MGFKQLQLQCGSCGELTPHTQKTPNHVLHALLTVFTGGLWAIGWVVAATTQDMASCGRCGTHRSARGQPTIGLLVAGSESQRIDAVDEALRKVKGPLLHCRNKHGIVGNVTFRMRYDALGSIVGVTIDEGPPNMTAGFIQESATIIKGMITLPRTANGGVMNFTDLGPEMTAPYRS
jgi:hypothetical protein